MVQQPRQLALKVGLSDQATFNNFLAVNTSLEQVIFFLTQFSNTSESIGFEKQPTDYPHLFCYLAGAEGSGRSHLLQACCHKAHQQGQTCQYLPLAELVGFEPSELLENMEQNEMICIDDIQIIAGLADWEQALFHLYNRVRDLGHKLLVSGSTVPGELHLDLADLVSRLGWGPVFHLEILSDESRIRLLQFRARKRGMTMSTEVGQYLLTRTSRDLPSLMRLLDRLDNQSLEQQRMLTIPFIKQLLDL